MLTCILRHLKLASGSPPMAPARCHQALGAFDEVSFSLLSPEPPIQTAPCSVMPSDRLSRQSLGAMDAGGAGGGGGGVKRSFVGPILEAHAAVLQSTGRVPMLTTMNRLQE